MKWLSKTAVLMAARKGHKEAIACSLKHWDQLYTATKTEIADALDNDSDIIYQKFCALCQRYCHLNSQDCGKCILRPKNKAFGCGPDSLWEKASDALLEWWGGAKFQRSEKKWALWKKCAKAMRDKLSKSLKQESQI